MCWFAATGLTTSGNALIYNGNGGGTGLGLIMQGTQLSFLFGGLGIIPTGYFPSAGFWHQYAWRVTPGVNQAVFVDGAQVYAAVAGIPNPVLAGQGLVGQVPDIGGIAHVAYWNSALTLAQINSVWVAGPGVVPSSSLTGRTANDVDVAAILDLLERIYAAVHHTFA